MNNDIFNDFTKYHPMVQCQAEAAYVIGKMYHIQNDFEQGIIWYYKSVCLSEGKFMPGLYGLGQLYFYFDKFDHAFTCLKKVYEEFDGAFSILTAKNQSGLLKLLGLLLNFLFLCVLCVLCVCFCVRMCVCVCVCVRLYWECVKENKACKDITGQYIYLCVKKKFFFCVCVAV